MARGRGGRERGPLFSGFAAPRTCKAPQRPLPPPPAGRKSEPPGLPQPGYLPSCQGHFADGSDIGKHYRELTPLGRRRRRRRRRRLPLLGTPPPPSPASQRSRRALPGPRRAPPPAQPRPRPSTPDPRARASPQAPPPARDRAPPLFTALLPPPGGCPAPCCSGAAVLVPAAQSSGPGALGSPASEGLGGRAPPRLSGPPRGCAPSRRPLPHLRSATLPHPVGPGSFRAPTPCSYLPGPLAGYPPLPCRGRATIPRRLPPRLCDAGSADPAPFQTRGGGGGRRLVRCLVSPGKHAWSPVTCSPTSAGRPTIRHQKIKTSGVVT